MNTTFNVNFERFKMKIHKNNLIWLIFYLLTGNSSGQNDEQPNVPIGIEN